MKENLLNLKEKLLEVKNKFQNKITAEQLAKDNDMEYIENPIEEQIMANKIFENSYIAKDNEYILMHLINDGISSCRDIWYTDKKEVIMSNENAFDNITNLSDLIISIINLYEKYIDSDIVINSSSFAIKLSNEFKVNYVGPASLVLTKDTLLDCKIKKEYLNYQKKIVINKFLDSFIGWNFGKIILENKELEERLINFNNKVIEKGLRDYGGLGYNLSFTDTVQYYKLRKRI